MKKIIFSLAASIFVLIFSVVFAFAEADGQGADTTRVPVQLNGSDIDIKTITYKGSIYVPLRDISHYMNSNLKIDKTGTVVNLLPKEGTAELSQDDTSSGDDGQIVNVKANPYIIRLEGIDTYMQSIGYNDVIYIPLRNFAEIFNKSVEYKEESNTIVLNDLPGDPVGSVNGEDISKGEFDYYYNYQLFMMSNNDGLPESDAEYAKLREGIFNSLVNRKLVLQEAGRKKLAEISQDDLDAINSDILKKVETNGGIENIRKLLGGANMNFGRYLTSQKESYIINRFQNELGKDVKVNDSEVRKYYDNNKNLFIKPETLKAKHILVSTRNNNSEPISISGRDAARARAEDLLKRVKAGENFDDLMNKYSEDPGLKSNPDGYTFARGEMIKEFEDAAFSTKLGGISNVIQTVYGFHIIKVEDKFPSGQKEFEEVRDDIRKQLESSAKTNYFYGTIDRLRAEGKITKNIK